MKKWGHHRCTLILPSLTAAQLRELHPGRVPRWMRERTHGCWCSSWRLTQMGFRIWRRGSWRKPKPGELLQSEVR